MSAEVIAGTAAGVTAAGVALVLDQNIAMASIGGVFMFLAVSVAIPLQTRAFFSIGSFILGYLVGLFMMTYGGLEIYAAISALIASGLGSSIFASLYQWFDGGKMPFWVAFLTKFLPAGMKKNGGSNE
jgi:hypothetical protein